MNHTRIACGVRLARPTATDASEPTATGTLNTSGEVSKDKILLRLPNTTGISSGLGTSDSPCSSSYHGIEPFSEVENRHIRDYVLSLSPTPTLALALHSAAELWLWPYGYDYNMFPDNVKELVPLKD